MDKTSEVKKEYDQFLSFVCEKLSDPEMRNSATLYFTAALLRIWGNSQYSPDYPALLSRLTGENYTMEQVMTAMSCCSDPERQLLIPEFFKKLVERDVTLGSEDSSRCILMLNRLLYLASRIDGTFTREENDTLRSIMADLVRHGSASGVKIPVLPDLTSLIAEKNEEKIPQTADKPEPPEEEPVSASLKIHIHLTTSDDSSQSQTEESFSETPSPSVPERDENETMESLLEELDSLVGLDQVKQDVHSLMNFIRVAKLREKRGMKVPTISYHLVFTGNPGTGKTTVARLVARLYYHMGILPQGQLIETDRSSLVAGYLGQTAIKTQKVIQQAMGGVLFIDEAYSLAGDEQDSYGREAIETILKAMEDHRDELVVIVAGYTELMHKFIESNPGLSSRFSKYIQFNDYSGEELLSVFECFCKKNGYRLEEKAKGLLRSTFDSLYENRDEHFGNARTARNIFEKAINAQADRLALLEDISDSDLETITEEDIAAATGGA